MHVYTLYKYAILVDTFCMAHAVYVCIEAQLKKREKNDITLPIFGRLFEFFFTQFHEKAPKKWQKS